MDIAIRSCTSADEVREAIIPIGSYFGHPTPSDDHLERLLRVLPPQRLYAAWEGSRAVGGLGSFPLRLTVPGGRVAAAGVTAAGVLPTHRRRGLLRSMMRALLDACRRQGEPVAYLWATEDTIYGRFGFGLASFTAAIDLPRARSAFHSPLAVPGRVRLVAPAAAQEIVAPIYQRVAAETPGMFERSPVWWQDRILADPQWRRGAGGELQCAVLDIDGQPSAYALYRINSAFERGLQSGAVEVSEAVALSPQAEAAIWRYLLDIDYMARVTARLLPQDHTLLLLLAEPRRLGFALRDGVWVRLVDLQAALSARSYQPQGSVVIEVEDQFCAWNSGRWRIGSDGVERTEEAAVLRCGASALGSAYLGGFSWTRLTRASRAEGLVPGAAAQADAIFQTGRMPWCPEIF